MRIPILYQDPDLIVVDKPAGVPTHAPDPSDPYPGDALRIVQAQTGLPYLGMHQRLDADTSGVLLFAARREANRALAAAFEGREVRKVYLALVHGAPPRSEGVIDAPIAREHGERYRVTTSADPRGLAARTRYRVLNAFVWESAQANARCDTCFVMRDDDESILTSRVSRITQYAPRSTLHAEHSPSHTLLELVPETGRPHQIRVHLAHIGCSVVGDPLYGPADCPAPRLYLHAYQLTLPHPATGQLVKFTAPPPEVLRADGDGSVGDRSGLSLRGLHSGPKQSRTPALKIASGYRLRNDAAAVGLGAEVAPHICDAIAAPEALRALLRLAVERRRPLAADPQTNIYRLVNGAADGLPGLTLDRYGEALVVSLYDSEPGDLRGLGDLEGLARAGGAAAIYIKYRPREAGRIPDDQLHALAPPEPVYGPEMREFIAHEEGLAYVIRPGEGLSTGLFPDMREGRARVRAWAAGRRVLNTFAYTCGFGVAAAAGGATRVLNLDLSKSVLEWGQANYRANGFEPDPHDFVFGDVFDWLVRLAKHGDRFDLVILDPPGFSRTKSRAFSAAHDYGELAGLAARVTAPGGSILACCNVAELSWKSFRERVLAGMTAAGRTPEVKGVYHEPALDFPTPMRSEPYLKMALVEVR
jgi:23S rRNA (cytosine1962-C5)-methyltransferase